MFIRVLSYNIHKARSAIASRAVLNELRLGLHGVAADLIFLQEVQGRNELQGVLHAQHESLAAALRLETAYGANAVRQHTDHGNALLSRFPILSFENQDISDHRLEQRGLLHAQVQIGKHNVHCFVVHFGLFAGGRSRQMEALAARIEELVPEDCPLLIAGDFNDWNDRLSPLLVERLNVHEVFSSSPHTRGGGLPRLRESARLLRDALGSINGGRRPAAPMLGLGGELHKPRPPRTFPAAFPWFRLDRIYHRGFAVRSARVLRGRPWTKLSDHAPLMAELELP